MRMPLIGSARRSSSRLKVTLSTGGAVALALAAVAAGLPEQAAVAAAPVTKAHVSAPSTATKMTADQALASAQASGQPVQVAGATTDTTTLTANPDGTFTSTQNVEPVRKFVGGAWKDLDPSLHTNADGSISPAVTSSALTLSGGGAGALATMSTNGRTLALSAPVTLPAPTISGPTATYTSVLSGVDLQVTVDAQGGFSEALVVHNATAAANPLLKSLTMAVKTSADLSLGSDANGNITAHDKGGQPLFTAPAPIMWDSTPSTATAVTDPDTGQQVDAHTGNPIASTAQAPGEAARTASLAAQTNATGVTLTPSQPLLSSAATTYPVYIDPTWNPDAAGSTRNSWTDVNSDFTTTSYWKTSSDLQVGDNNWNSPYFVARSFINVSIPSAIYGATVQSSSMSILEDWSPSCTAKTVQLWKTGTINSSTDWDNQPGWTSEIDSASVAHGYSSSCSPANVPFDTTTIMQNAADSKWTNLTVGLRASDESDGYGWKKFSNQIAKFTTTYDHAPNIPTTLSTSPATTCAGTLTTVGDGDVALFARVSDPDATASHPNGDPVGTTFTASNATTGTVIATSSNSTAISSGSTAKYTLTRATLDSTAAGAVTKITWKVQATDYKYTSNWSTTCSFNFDPTRTGAPVITDPGGEVIGTASTFTIAAPPTGTAPTSYSYQLDGAAPVSVTATGTSTPFTVKPTRFTNTVTVTGVSAGGNVGDSAVLVFNSAPAATAPDSDLTGDGIPDLLTVGAADGLPSGLWLTSGQAGTGHTTGDGQLITSSTDIGANGAGISPTGYGPADFNGTIDISGHFSGTGLQDILTYFPTGTNAGGASVLLGNGDGSPIPAQDNASRDGVPAGSFTDDIGGNPVQIANAGNMSNRSLATPDLIAVNDNAGSYYLTYYPSLGETGSYDFAARLTTLAPDGTANWNLWTIVTAQTATGTDMFLWNTSTHALYLWVNPSYNNDGTFTIGTQYLVSSSWNPGTGAQLQAADINGDGTPDLWATVAGPSTTAYLITNLSTTAAATVTAQPAQTLLTGTHTWQLNDDASGTLTTGTDTTGTLNLTGNSGVTGNTGDLFTPDATLNGTSGILSTATPALATNADFSASAWVKPTATGGAVFAQEDSHMSGMYLYLDSATSKWTLGMAKTDANSGATDSTTSTGAAVQLGVWAHIAVTYKASTGTLALYVDGIESHRVTHTSPISTSGSFHIGNYLNNSTQTGYFKGQIGDVQVWNQTLTPSEIAQQSGTPGYVLFESDNTNYVSGSTWTTAHGRMTFTAGLLSIIETNNANTTVTFGASGHSSGVLSVQTDGNTVIYPTSTHTGSLWATGTSGHSNDAMFLQPDGNLVLYDSDGAVLWSSGTNN